MGQHTATTAQAQSRQMADQLAQDLRSGAAFGMPAPSSGLICRDCGERTHHPHLDVCRSCAQDRYSEKDGCS